MADKKINLYGRIILNGRIRALTGLHIGGSAAGLEIGGVDMPVIRTVYGVPYIPGSSLKGKMRSLSEKIAGCSQNQPVGKNVSMHTCKTLEDYLACKVCPIYGTMGDAITNAPTRLIVRDIPLDESSLKGAHTDLPFSEVKWEASIDRVTSAASPRQIERVPAGAVFGGADGGLAEMLIYSIYEREDITRFGLLLSALQWVEDDYLGGQGSRGSGQVRFERLSLALKTRSDDQPHILADLPESATLSDLLSNKESILRQLPGLLGLA